MTVNCQYIFISFKSQQQKLYRAKTRNMESYIYIKMFYVAKLNLYDNGFSSFNFYPAKTGIFVINSSLIG